MPRDACICCRRGRWFPLLGYLRGLGVVPGAVAAMSLTPGEALIERYSAYLAERRGLSLSTVRNYVGVARVFVSWREAAAGTLALGELDGAVVIEFVLGESQRCSVGSAKCMVTRLRVFLRFLHVGARSTGNWLGWCRRSRAGGSRDWSRHWTPGRSRCCWRVVTGAPGSGVAISRSSRCWRGLGCAPVRSQRCGSQTSIGGRVSCSSGGRAAAMSGCRCPLMSAKRSPAGCRVAARGASRCSCSVGFARRTAGSQRAGSRRSCVVLASGRGYRS